MFICFKPKSDLSGVIQIMAIVFGEEPPVFARPPGAVQPQRPPYPTNSYNSSCIWPLF